MKQFFLSLSLLTFTPFILAAATKVQVSSVTATQAVLQIDTAQSSKSCNVEVSESPSFQPVVHDVDASLFNQANLDLPNVSVPTAHRTFVAGTRRVDTALNGKRYSRALQANTQHYYRVSCSSEVATGTFTTLNPPLGNTFPELPNFDATAFGNLADPTIDWSDKTLRYIDPITGIALRRVTAPGESGDVIPGNHFTFAYDAQGAWSNGTSGKSTSKASGTLATTSKLNAPLFLSWDEIHNFQLTWGGANFNPLQGTVDDLLLRIHGSGQNAALQACISLDSGKTCTSSQLSVSLPNSPGVAAPVPSSFPSPIFGGWGRAFSTWEISNRSSQNGANTNAGSHIVSAPAGSFSPDWPAGVKLRVQGSGCNGNDVCTIASVQNTGQLTTLEATPRTASNAAWQVYAAGIRLTLVSGSQASVSATFDYAESQQSVMGDNTDQLYCSESTVHDIYKDRNGKPLSTPLSGRLCNFSHGLYLAVDGEGEFRLLSSLVMNSKSPLPGQRVNLPTNGSFSTTDPKTFYGNLLNRRGLFRGTYTGDYTPYKPGGSSLYISGTVADDSVQWTDIMPAGSGADVTTQLAADSTIPGAATSLFSSPNYVGLVGGYGEFFVSPFQGSDRICEVVRYDLNTGKIVQLLNSWTTWPVRWGGCHFGPMGHGTFQIGYFNPIVGKNSANPLGGPFELHPSQAMKGGVWTNNTSLSESLVWNASNSSPVVITTATTADDNATVVANDHQFLEGEPVTIFGAESNQAINTPAGGTFYAKVSYSDTILTGALTASGSSVTVRDASRMSLGGNTHAMLQIDGEHLVCAAASGQTLTGCTRGTDGTSAAVHSLGAAVRQINSFALFQDKALTQPVAGNGAFSFNGNTYVADYDQCPAGLDPKWTNNMLLDSTGAVGRRCSTIRVTGEPHSHYAYYTTFAIGGGLTSITVSGDYATVKLSAPSSLFQPLQQVVVGGANLSSLDGKFVVDKVLDATTFVLRTPGVSPGVHSESTLFLKHPTEHYAYPWKADPNNLDTSSLQDLQEGDFLKDLYSVAYSEQMVVVKKKKNSETDIELTLMRHWGDKVYCDSHARQVFSNRHPNGWTPFATSSYGCMVATGYADIGDKTWSIGDTRIGNQHSDIGPGVSNGLFTLVSAGGFAPESNLTFSQLMNTPPVDGVVKEFPVFGTGGAMLHYGTNVQGYPAFRQTTAPSAEKVWKADFHALNNSYGASQDSPVGLTTGMALTSIRGARYDSGSQTTSVYKLTGMASGLDHKRLPLTGFSGYHYLADMSGPGSSIDDSGRWRLCVADFKGECRPNSEPGDVFVNVPAADLPQDGWCFSNGYEHNIPCIFTPNSVGGWGVQWQIDPPDKDGSKGRRLTMGFVNPGRHFTFSNWVPSPDGQWGFLSPPWINGVRNDIFAMKLPPWPAVDDAPRNDFVPLHVAVSALASAPFARVLFGYAENGPPSNFYCTARREACASNGTSAKDGVPFLWLSEPHQGQPCQSGCTVTVPTIPGRVVYYRVDWLDASGHVLSSGVTNAQAALP